MKRSLFIGICLLLSLSVLIGCNKIFIGSDSENALEPIVSDNLGVSDSESDNEVSMSPVDIEESLILVVSDEKTIVPLVKWLWSETWTEFGWLSVDGISLNNKLPDIVDELPLVNFSDNFSVQYKENVSFSGLSIFNNNFERLYHNVDLSYLDKLAEGTYFVVIQVLEQGEYIDIENEYEVHGYECAFKIVVNK